MDVHGFDGDDSLLHVIVDGRITAAEMFAIFLLRNVFIGIPRDLLEAARIDGASELGAEGFRWSHGEGDRGNRLVPQQFAARGSAGVARAWTTREAL
jgi:hypothetical protein